jgi:hypothetical protein
MEVLVDGKQYAGDLTGGTLQDILGDLANKAVGDGSTMREVKINGEPFEESKLGPADSLGRDYIQRLEVETIPAREMAVHFLSNAHSYLAAINQSVARVAEMFRVNDEQEANEHYLNTLESIQLFLQMLQECRQIVNLDFDSPLLDGMSGEERLQKLLVLIKDMLSAQEQQDWVLLADIMQYDLSAELDLWQGFMQQFKEMSLS